MKREARDCKGKRCKTKKAGKQGKKGRGKGKYKGKKRNKTKGQRKTRTKKKQNKKANKNTNKDKVIKEKKKDKINKIKGRYSGYGRQITGNATSCAMKAIKYARLFEGKATSIFRQVGILNIFMMKIIEVEDGV